MNIKKISSLIFVALNFFILLFLVEKVQNPQDIYKNFGIERQKPSVLPAQDTYTNEATVVKVIDGDTIEIEGGTKVRYIGIDTPEIGSKKECYANEAKKKNEELVLGKRVSLEKDVSETDRYGRLLRYVYTDESGQKVMVNEKLVSEGFANVLTYPPDIRNSKTFVELERKAREDKLGLWAACI